MPEQTAIAEQPMALEAPPPEAPAAKPAQGKQKPAKEKKGKGAEKQGAVVPDGPSIAGHPRAARSVARAKGWGALIGFLLGGYLSLPTHTLADAGVRALVSGAILYVAVWAGAVFAWKRLVVIEIKAREAELLSAAQTAMARRQERASGAGSGARQGADG